MRTTHLEACKENRTYQTHVDRLLAKWFDKDTDCLITVLQSKVIGQSIAMILRNQALVLLQFCVQGP